MRDILAYFDLNRRFSQGRHRIAPDDDEGIVRGGQRRHDRMSPFQQAICYVGIIIGVLVSGYVNGSSSKMRHPTLPSIGEVILSFVIALVIVPQAYERVPVRTDLPVIVQIGLFVQQGVFWETTVALLGKTVRQ